MARIFALSGVVIGVIVAVFAALIITVHVIDWSAHRTWVASWLSHQLDRDVRIERDLDIVLFPAPEVVAKGLVIGSKFPSEDSDLAHIGYGKWRLDISALLRGELLFSLISLSETQIFLPNAQQVGSKFFLPVQRIELNAVTIDIKSIGPAPVSITNGVIIRDAAVPRAKVRMSGQLGEQRLSIAGVVGWRETIDRVDLVAIDLTVDMDSTVASVRGRINHLTRQNDLELALRIQTTTFDRLAAWWGWSFPAPVERYLEGSTTLAGTLRGVLGGDLRFDIGHMALKVPHAEVILRGELSRAAVDDSWRARVAVRASTVDLGRLLPEKADVGGLTGVAELRATATVDRQSISLSDAFLEIDNEALGLEAHGWAEYHWHDSSTKADLMFVSRIHDLHDGLQGLGCVIPLDGTAEARGRLHLRKGEFLIDEATLNVSGEGWALAGHGQLGSRPSSSAVTFDLALHAEATATTVFSHIDVAGVDGLAVFSARGHLTGNTERPRIDQLVLDVTGESIEVTARGEVARLLPTPITQLAFTAHMHDLDTYASALGADQGLLPEVAVDGQGLVAFDGERLALRALEGAIQGAGLRGVFTGEVPDANVLHAARLALNMQLDSLADLGIAVGPATVSDRPVELKFDLTHSNNNQRPLAIKGEMKADTWSAEVRAEMEGLRATSAYQLQMTTVLDPPQKIVTPFSRELPVTVPLTARLELHGQLENSDGVIGRLDLKAEGVELTLQGNLLSLGKKDRSVDLMLKADSLRRLGPLLSASFPTTAPVRMTGRLKKVGQGVAIAPFRLDLGGSDFYGAIRYHPREDERQAAKVTGHLISNRFDRKDFKGPDTPGNALQERPRFFSGEPFLLNWISSHDIDIDYRAAKVIFNTHRLDDLQAQVIVEDGILSVDNAHAGMYSGTLQLNLALDGNQRPYKVRYGYLLRGMEIERWPTERSDTGRLTGNVDIELQIVGSGDSVREVVADANGHALIIIHNAKIPHKTRKWLQTSILMAILKTIIPFSEDPAAFNVECGLVGFRINDGVAVSDHTAVLQAKEMAVLASGGINLDTEELEFSIRTKVRQGLGISPESLSGFGPGHVLSPQYVLGGTLSEPLLVRPDRVLKTGVTLGAAWLTGGVTVLVQGLFDRWTSQDVCRKAATRFSKSIQSKTSVAPESTD